MFLHIWYIYLYCKYAYLRFFFFRLVFLKIISYFKDAFINFLMHLNKKRWNMGVYKGLN